MNTEALKSWTRFIKVFNDTKKYPSVAHVAVELGISYQTVRNKAAIARKLSATDASFPQIINRSPKTEKPASDAVSPEEHARNRALAVAADVHDLITGTDYPVINPEVVHVESFMHKVYDRATQDYIDVEGQPRTWLSDTLKVASVKDCRGKRFIFTGAQNDAPIHQEFWLNLKVYAKAIGAQIVVGPWTYETSWWSENNPLARRYDDRIADHMCFGQMEIGPDFVFCGEMNTLPTAGRPISDLTTYSRGKWAVFPHSKLQLKSVPSTDPKQQAHQVMTTGAVTKPKVVPRKAGIKSIFHHVIGATLVEFDAEGRIFCRQINADSDGSLYDLDIHIDRQGVMTRGHRVKAIVGADIHRAKLSTRNAKAVFGFDPNTGAKVPGSIVEALDPEYFFCHDVFDNETRNHHNIHDNALSYELAVRGRTSVENEVKQTASFLKMLQDAIRGRVMVVESNHDLALERYVREGRYRNDGINIRYGLELENAYLQYRERAAHAADAETRTPTFSLLEHAVRQANKSLTRVGWIHDAQSFKLDDVEHGHHGFRGANGARGTVVGFAALGTKMSIGDKHSPEILDGLFVSGVMQLQHGYNKGPSGWGVACTVQYPNGKRTLITLQDGFWRA